MPTVVRGEQLSQFTNNTVYKVDSRSKGGGAILLMTRSQVIKGVMQLTQLVNVIISFSYQQSIIWKVEQRSVTTSLFMFVVIQRNVENSHFIDDNLYQVINKRNG